jgi:sterol desaturase/sphingolipid hydroxylase (fatty acid hydroxylase superfamily)
MVTIFGEVLGVLLVYDFIYYWFHRVFHKKELMIYMHGVHHKMRFPTAMDATYLNPLENFGGLAILFIAISLFAPVSEVSFILIIVIHAFINIIVHTNMVLPHPIFMLTNFWAIKHDAHHGKHLNKNYANIFPYWDQMFGTSV